jgi:hypothetical protein
MPNKTIGQLPLLPGPSGTNEFAIWNGSKTFRISLDTIKQYSISGITDNDIFVTGGTYDTLTSTINLYRNDGVIIPITGISTDDIYLTGGTYDDSLVTLTDNKGGIVQFNIDVTSNRWHVPSGTTLTVKNGFQSFIYGDLYVEGLLKLEDDSQLVVLNGDIILSGGSISGAGTTLLVDLPQFDTKTVSGSFDPNTGIATFTNNSGGTFSVSGFYTGSTEIFVTGGTYNSSNGIATFTNNTGGTFNVSGFLSGYTDFYTTGATLIGATAYFDRTDTLSAYTLDLSGIDFTGNTSASCISDLYLSNLHGCSPITIHDSIQSNGSTASGLYSFAFGNSTLASNDYSHAEGANTTAIGQYSHAEGQFTTAQGTRAHAEGNTTIAAGEGSHAEGGYTQANGDRSHAEGVTTTASGFASHAEGEGTTASVDYSHAEGRFSKAFGLISHAEGYQTSTTGSFSHSEGQLTLAQGTASHAEGWQTSATNNGSHSEGRETKALGDSSHAEGAYTTASNTASHAEGYQTKATGQSAHAEGNGTSASADYSHAEGYLTTASGNSSHSEGYLTTAKNNYTHAGGISSVASGLNSFIHSSGSTVTGLRSVVLGGKGLTGPANDTVYVPNFNSRGNSLFSGSSSGVVTIKGSGSTTPIFTVQGSSGELFSVTDSLIGSLFSVNDISGLPVLEVFSDNTILMGNYQSPSLNTTVKKSLTSGTNNIYSIPTSGYTGAFFDYTLISASGARAGNIMSIWSGSSAQYTDTSTNDIGNTTGVTFSVVVSGSSAVLQSTSATSGWTLKTIVRSI